MVIAIIVISNNRNGPIRPGGKVLITVGKGDRAAFVIMAVMDAPARPLAPPFY